MRNGLFAAFLVCIFSSTNPLAPALTDEGNAFADERFFATLDKMIPVKSTKPAQDRFSIDSAAWVSEDRSLLVKVSTEHAKGTLLTLMGLPASTMVDAFQISSGHTVEYLLLLDEEQAVPCQVTVKSAFESKTVAVVNAPSACQRMLQVSGTVAVGPTLPMVNGWVTVAVNDVIFATIADKNGNYDLDVYGESNDAFVTITAEGMVNNQESVVHIYAGSIEELLNANQLTASSWAAEILGRKHTRLMLAAL